MGGIFYGGEAPAIQQTAKEKIADAEKSDVDDGDKGIDPSPMGGGDSAGHVRLVAQSVEDLAQRKEYHQQEAQGQLQLSIAIAVKAQYDESLANQNFPDISDAAREGGNKRRCHNDDQGIDAGYEAEYLGTFGPIQHLHIQRQQMVVASYLSLFLRISVISGQMSEPILVTMRHQNST